MDPNTDAQCSHDIEESDNPQSKETHTESESIYSKEMCTKTTDLCVVKSSCAPPPQPFQKTGSHYSHYNNEVIMTASVKPSRVSMPLVIISRPPSLVIGQSNETPQIIMPSNLQSPSSITSRQPQTLFLQALAKLREASLITAVANHYNIQQITDSTGRTINIVGNSELSTPDSLGSAPPSYSFVLRQMAVRRRPRIVGTFIPSPSFIHHTPPPNYNAAFDIYVDNSLPPPTTRVYNFGFASMPVVCPDCGFTGMTLVHSKVTLCTHLCAFVLCVFCCWICVPLPYILRSCKNVYHYCRNCRNFLGLYRPTNPENAFS